MDEQFIESTIRIGGIPSYGDKCPKRDCNQFLRAACREHSILWRCPCGYEAIEVTGESKWAFADALRAFIRVRR